MTIGTSELIVRCFRRWAATTWHARKLLLGNKGVPIAILLMVIAWPRHLGAQISIPAVFTTESMGNGCTAGTSTSSFTTAQPVVWVWYQLQGGQQGDNGIVQWIGPTGRVEVSFPFGPAPTAYGGTYCWDIAIGQGTPLGNWSVQLVTNGVVNFTLPFTVNAPTGTSGFLIQNDVVNSSITFANPSASFQDTFSLGPQSLGLFFEVKNPPASLSYRLRYLRPDTSMAFDSGTVSTGIPGPPSDWFFLNWNTLNLNIPGKWNIVLDLNGAPAGSAPFSVNLGTGNPACGAIDVSNKVGLQEAGFVPNPPLYNLYSRSITVTNQASQPIRGPIYLVFDGLPQANTFACPLPGACSVAAAVAITHCQSPSPNGGSVVLLSTSDLAAGKSITVRPQFLPAKSPPPASPYVMFNYTLRLFTGEPQ